MSVLRSSAERVAIDLATMIQYACTLESDIADFLLFAQEMPGLKTDEFAKSWPTRNPSKLKEIECLIQFVSWKPDLITRVLTTENLDKVFEIRNRLCHDKLVRLDHFGSEYTATFLRFEKLDRSSKGHEIRHGEWKITSAELRTIINGAENLLADLKDLMQAAWLKLEFQPNYDFCIDPNPLLPICKDVPKNG